MDTDLAALSDKVIDFLRGKLGDDDLTTVAEMFTYPIEMQGVGMDSARIARGVSERMRALNAARAECSPVIGQGQAMAYDSAEGVYGAALRALGKDTQPIPAAAFKAIYKAMRGRPAMDAAMSEAFGERHPEAGRVGVA